MKMQLKNIAKDVVNITNDVEFEKIALELFQIHAGNNLVYRDYLHALSCDISSVKRINDIPFLPIDFFKTSCVGIDGIEVQQIFRSSGTSGMSRSEHGVVDLDLYHEVSTRFFESIYGSLRQYCVLGLLPSYLERKDSSLVNMVHHFMECSQNSLSGFFLDNKDELKARMNILAQQGQPTLLFGVTFALIDLAKELDLGFPSLVIIETGGMKGRGEEIVREQLHKQIKESFPASKIHSEYGMTELLSQAYKEENGYFQCPPWMKVYARDVSDPLSRKPMGSGALDIVDLANLYSCPFISTMDLAKVYANGFFDVLGRIDHADIRGCGLLVL